MLNKISNQKKGILLVFTTAIISGIAIFVNGLFIAKISPSTFTFLKNTLVAFALLGLIFSIGALTKQKISTKKTSSALKSITKKQWGLLVIIGLIGGSIPFLLFFEGLSMTSGTAGAFIHKTMFIFVAILAVLFLKEKLNKWIMLFAVLLLAGNLLLLKTDFAVLGIGHLLILTATLFWAAENTLSKHILKDLSGTTVAFGRMFFGSIFILMYLGITGQLGTIATLSMEQWTLTLTASALLLGYVLTWYNGLKHVPVTLATSILLLGAPITTLLNFAFLEKGLAINQGIGIVLITGGIVGWISMQNKTAKVTVSVKQMKTQK